MAQEYFPAQTAAFRTDPRVHLHFLDGRRFLSETKDKFDVIVVDVPDPQTAQLNRFYTVEFFRLARAHLAPDGLFATQLRSSEETISPDLAEFLRSIRRTLGEVFPYQAAIPGETIHFFGAAEPGVLTRDPQLLVSRLRERHLATQYVREYFIPYRMMPDRMEQVETELAPLHVNAREPRLCADRLRLRRCSLERAVPVGLYRVVPRRRALGFRQGCRRVGACAACRCRAHRASSRPRAP